MTSLSKLDCPKLCGLCVNLYLFLPQIKRIKQIINFAVIAVNSLSQITFFLLKINKIDPFTICPKQNKRIFLAHFRLFFLKLRKYLSFLVKKIHLYIYQMLFCQSGIRLKNISICNSYCIFCLSKNFHNQAQII
jgi:hypothetical protein